MKTNTSQEYNLYSSHNPHVKDSRFNLLFENGMIKKLDEDHKKSCEGLLTENECLAALKSFQKNKTPGTEFYIFFGIN